MNPVSILKSMYPDKFSELCWILRTHSPASSTEAIEEAAGEVFVGLGQCKSEAEVVQLIDRVFRDMLDVTLAPDAVDPIGHEVHTWREGWTDVLF